jgi:hypothetical protein
MKNETGSAPPELDEANRAAMEEAARRWAEQRALHEALLEELLTVPSTSVSVGDDEVPKSD